MQNFVSTRRILKSRNISITRFLKLLSVVQSLRYCLPCVPFAFPCLWLKDSFNKTALQHIYIHINIYTYRHSWQKKVVTPRDDVSFLWLFLYYQSARSKDRLFGVIYCFLCIWFFFYSVVLCQFWLHLMIKGVISRICIPKCHWKIIVVNLVEQRWFFSWRWLVVSFCVRQVNIGYSRLSRR